MKKIWIMLLLASIGLASCVTVSEEVQTEAPPAFVTSTLPPTRPGLSLSTDTPSASTPDSSTTTPGTPGGSETAVSTSASAGECQDSALMIADVTIPDDTQMSKGQTFTKTWRFMNNGKCNWSGYTIAFVAGDRMASPDTAPVPDTEAGKTVDVSVQLTAPSADGSYTGFYELRKTNGETLPIGIESTFWIRISIGDAPPVVVNPPAFTPVSGVPTVRVTAPGSCNYSTSSSYQTEIANLINQARSEAGLTPLNINPQLTAAAQGHSIDMACHGLLSHSGSDGSSPSQRVAAAGYAASRSSEIIYGSGYPQTAFQWWMNDQIHRDEILNPYVIDMGVGYAYVPGTAAGGYYTVNFASP
jgi:uncharacterized protein YkwD